ncbi:MAG: DUF3078 domain-containing protein [Muribaculaceae bacterium]|nr:DUF3078 domain-containing protein [Muribaculaceae bacterium]
MKKNILSLRKLFSAAFITVATVSVSSAFANPVSDVFDIEEDEVFPTFISLADSLLMANDTLQLDTVIVFDPLSKMITLPPVYTNYQIMDNWDPFKPEITGEPWMEWIEKSQAVENRTNRLLQNFMVQHPDLVHLNVAFMETPPKKYYGTVNPSEHTIEIHEVEINAPKKMEIEVKKKHWLRTFNSSLQFSQAYVSPNWYQGGNNNLNILANIYYNVKLNNAFHPNLLFESTMQYKLGVNGAPDDELHSYSISEDLLQFNLSFGYKAARNWYYSVTAQFKTQVLTSYATNSTTRTSAFMSPADLTLGLGMTYNHTNAKKTFTFDTSISPLSMNMKICTMSNEKLPHSNFGIDADKYYIVNIGSSAEAKMTWQICDNISWRSRFFIFTDYHYVQADWENTISFDINRYLTTQIYVHCRYDTSTPAIEDVKWHKFQLKEILSFGVAYKFSSL